ncbi:16S rRNA (guanine(966)-N(2))-methyltransferase RsmD [Moraxella catarrhalis]|uniref:Ribosomal RNA small subunit methyltransferase D n=1 Tax=Moraxella catarrhalis TaxID=480 RepID=A0AB36DN88_MORCA|nr:16S rRNA (guanine(966)-N(2))-methyltransferase RsmD [Moraxella catarrhalis]MPX28912.1 16S rRNA (guanine(966)-N(2))-methyltransferase RsmD [Moraxella catarrhalis]OAV25121.1 Ribosomal RNA small subunit methyltransferase D [Moraxella catarrhalis]OAV25780.1 Ribosomal RNA small subunit methyltransferase D [Moraxella catarrhalis]RKL88529.1 16S rRNA (guanine(966)-N(2))-methyltransferase RsmD [Moraxella catarrhalis]RKL89436.1 16S rRNA (guanine(966)-N(2))-methyltransferase RsmD [Moraxella catarrhali
MKKPTQKSTKAVNQVRIIGGQHKRRLLTFVDAQGLRPTPDRLKETLFNWLTGYLTDAKILDACAGSGALGFEAVSRGAKTATLIEPNLAQAQMLKQNAKLLRLSDKLTIVSTDAISALNTMHDAFDIIFIDPPYALNLWQPILKNLLDNALIHADSKIYLEADKPLHGILDDDTSAKFTLIKSTKVGQAMAYLLTPVPN